MSSNFLTLTNAVLSAFNEVQLTSVNFTSATGFHSEAKRDVLQAVFDVYTYQDVEWPFLFSSTTFATTVGTVGYTTDATFTKLDWDSFRIQRATATASTLTSSSTTATFTATGAHNFLTGDTVTISGATPDGYNGTVSITVTGSTTFTYTVASGLSTPATGTIIASSETVVQRRLFNIDYDKYRTDFWDYDSNVNSTGYARPEYVVQKTDKNIILSGVPDRVYTVYYEGFVLPTTMSAYSDTCSVPTTYDQVIVDKALHYAYMFRDNIEQANLAQKRYEDNIHKMRRVEIPQPEFMRVSC